MTAKELKKLSRKDLLEILLEQSKQLRQLRQELKQAQEALASRDIRLENCGSIAQAALELNGVFQAAEAAAQQYLDNMARMEQECQQAVQQRLAQTDETCQRILARTKAECWEEEE